MERIRRIFTKLTPLRFGTQVKASDVANLTNKLINVFVWTQRANEERIRAGLASTSRGDARKRDVNFLVRTA